MDFVNKKFTRLAGAADKAGGSPFDAIHAFGGRRRCNVTDGGVVVAYQGDTAFTTTGALTQAVEIDGVTYAVGTAVQVMVEQPKFYYKVVPLLTEIIDEGEEHGYYLRKARYYVSDTKKAGFKLHPAFKRNGNENDFIYLSAFEGSVYDVSASAYILDDAQTTDFTVSTGDKLSSIANAKPASGLTQNLTRANTRKLAQNRGTGWEQAYMLTASASQLLMLVEYASFNMQSKIGNGVVSKASGEGNESELTGTTVNLGNASGESENASGQKPVSYRGEENFWGNIWTWLDGCNEQNPGTFAAGDRGTLYIADHGFADDTGASPYQDTGIHPVYSGGSYINAFGYSEDFDFLFVLCEIGGASNLPVGDYFYNNGANWRVGRLGGYWYNGANAGAFYLTLNSAASTRTRNVGGRLVYVPSAQLETA